MPDRPVSGMVASDVQSRKASSPISVTPGPTTRTRLEQAANAPVPIFVTLDGSVTVVSDVHPAKQSGGISVTELDVRSTDVRAVWPANTPSAISAIAAPGFSVVAEAVKPITHPSREIDASAFVVTEMTASYANTPLAPPPVPPPIPPPARPPVPPGPAARAAAVDNTAIAHSADFIFISKFLPA